MSQLASSQPNFYAMSWDNPMFSANLSPANILDYFCNLTNPFYDRECNNEIIRMQRLNPEQLVNLTGIEYYLHHCQYRRSSTEVTPLSYYYIINGTVLQAPDLSRLYNSRIHTAVHSLDKCLTLLYERARYHPADGTYSWVDDNEDLSMKYMDTEKQTQKNENSSTGLYQSLRVNYLLSDWIKKFPVPVAKRQQGPVSGNVGTPASETQISKGESAKNLSLPPTGQQPAIRPPSAQLQQELTPTKKPRLN